MTSYPSLHALRKKDAQSAVAQATATTKSSLASNPLVVKKLKRVRGKRTVLKVGLVVVALLLVSSSVFAARMLTVGNGIFGGNSSDGFFAQLRALFGDSQPLIGESEDRVNVLLLGIGGEGHDGPNLSDTIIVASIKPSTGEAAMLSVPRDLFVPIGDFGQNKINSAFAFGEELGYEGGGAALATKTVEAVTGLEIPYYVVVDFKGFEKIVDDMGGVDVEIPRDYTDTLHKLDYTAGPHHYSGTDALFYVRGRYIYPENEGGDFNRAERTQRVAKSLQQKALTLNPVSDVGTITNILQSLGEHVRTNFQPSEIRRVYELVHELSLDQIRNKVIDESETGLVYGDSVPMGGLNISVLLPSDPSLSAIQDYAENVFEAEAPKPEDATLEVHNGTETSGIASSFAETVTIDTPVIATDNAARSDYDDSFIVDNTGGTVPNALKQLQDALKTLGIDARVLTGDKYKNSSSADLLLVLGQDYADATGESAE
jgi:LCP family protein required for cell wall assembly